MSILSYTGFCERLVEDDQHEKLAKFQQKYLELSGIPRDIFLLDSVAYYLGIPVNDGSPEFMEFCVTGDRLKWKQSREARLKKEQQKKAN